MFVVALWISAELYAKGADEAFGGVFAGERAPEPIARTQRASEAFQRAYDSSERRVDAVLDEGN